MAHSLDGTEAGSSAPDLFVSTFSLNPTSDHHIWRELSDGGARVALTIHQDDVAFRPGAFYVGVYSKLGGAHVVLPTCCMLLVTCHPLLCTCCLLLLPCCTCFATRFIGDYILSADVLEPSADVPGLDAAV